MNSILARMGMAALLGATVLLTGFKANGGTDPNLALINQPAVGDIYAADLHEFSMTTFTDDDDKPLANAYGLMKVVEVDDDKVVVITEAAASGVKAISRQDILGDLKDITFDEEERIDIVLPQLRKAYELGRIYEVRR
ncbi:MAG TPA: hypothetical protein VEY92_01700 [Pseudoxanthomonas sp.]|nr:hypothetical protein [Pseudoxanthomonas sp.]